MSTNTINSYFQVDVPMNVCRSLPQGGLGYIMMHIERPAKEFSGSAFSYRVSFAFCSPVDRNVFSRKDGMKKILEKDDDQVIEFVSPHRLKAREISEHAIMLMLANHQQVKTPHWVRQSPRENITPARVFRTQSSNEAFRAKTVFEAKQLRAKLAKFARPEEITSLLGK